MAKSELFNEGWYLARYPDVASQGMDAAVHYLEHGGREGRSPGPAFNAQWYLERNADVREAGLNPLIHYLENGQAEGRRIRPVEKTPKQRLSRHDLEQRLSITDQHPAEIISGSTLGYWKAGRQPFGALDCYLSRSHLADEIVALAETDRLIIDGRCVIAEPDNPCTRKLALCLKSMIALASPANSTMKPDELASSVSAMGHGGLSIQDIWFSNDFTIRLRIGRIRDDQAANVIVRCCQQTDSGSLAICGEATADVIGPAIVEARVENRFRPILIIVCDASGTLIDCCLIAFPSLARGGFHYAERWSASTTQTLPTAQDHSFHLLLDRSQSDASLVSRIEIDLSKATGNEALFDDDFLRWLTIDLGLEISTVGTTSSTMWLAEKIAAIPGPSPRESTGEGRTIKLPATAIPALHLLFAADGTSDGNFTRYLVADPITREPVGEWALRLRSDLPSGENIPQLELDEAGSARPGGPLAIIFDHEPKAPAKLLFPISSDAPLPIETTASSSSQTTISVIITSEADSSSVASLATSLSNQAGDLGLELILSCPSENIDWSLVEALAPFPIVRLSGTEESAWQRASAAAEIAKGSMLLFASGRLALHDARLLSSLSEFSKREGVGTVGCALISEEARGKNPGFSAHVGYTAALADSGSSEFNFQQQQLAHSLLPPYLLLAANSPHCMLVDRAVWDQCNQAIPEGGDEWLAFGLEVAGRGLDNICITWLTASCHSPGSKVAAAIKADVAASGISAFKSFGS